MKISRVFLIIIVIFFYTGFFFLMHVVIIIRGENIERDRCTGAMGVARIYDWGILAVDERDLSARGWTKWSVYEKRDNNKKERLSFYTSNFLFINRLYVIRTHVYVYIDKRERNATVHSL